MKKSIWSLLYTITITLALIVVSFNWLSEWSEHQDTKDKLTQVQTERSVLSNQLIIKNDLYEDLNITLNTICDIKDQQDILISKIDSLCISYRYNSKLRNDIIKLLNPNIIIE